MRGYSYGRRGFYLMQLSRCKASFFWLMTAGGTAAGVAASAGTAGTRDCGRQPAAVPGEGNAGGHYALGLIMTARAGSLFVRLAERPHQFKGEFAIGTGVFINGHLYTPTLSLRL